MKDELTFYQTDTLTLEQKIMARDLIVGNEIAGHLERLGRHLGTLFLSKVAIGDILTGVEEVLGIPCHIVLGRGERRLEPSGPTTYCARHVPSELGEIIHGIKKLQSLSKKRDGLSEDEQAKKDTWTEVCQRIGLDKEPQDLEDLRRFLARFRGETPELISVYTRW